MRATFIATLVFAASAASAPAGASISREQAVSKAHAEGFSLVSKAEAVPNAWDIWASKDGIPYEVRIDAHSGDVVLETPVESDD